MRNWGKSVVRTSNQWLLTGGKMDWQIGRRGEEVWLSVQTTEECDTTLLRSWRQQKSKIVYLSFPHHGHVRWASSSNALASFSFRKENNITLRRLKGLSNYFPLSFGLQYTGHFYFLRKVLLVWLTRRWLRSSCLFLFASAFVGLGFPVKKTDSTKSIKNCTVQRGAELETFASRQRHSKELHGG